MNEYCVVLVNTPVLAEPEIPTPVPLPQFPPARRQADIRDVSPDSLQDTVEDWPEYIEVGEAEMDGVAAPGWVTVTVLYTQPCHP